MDVQSGVRVRTGGYDYMSVSKGVAKDILYFNAWWRGHPAVAKALATNLDKVGVQQIVVPSGVLWTRCVQMAQSA